MSTYLFNTVEELKKANESLVKTQASIEASERHIKTQAGFTLWILLLTAIIAGVDVYFHFFAPIKSGAGG